MILYAVMAEASVVQIFVAGIVPMIVDAAGLKGRDGHTVNETADLDILAVQTKRAAVTIARLTQGAAR